MTTADKRVNDAARTWQDRLSQRRSWVILVVVFALGVADLVFRGWSADGRVLFLAGVGVAALLLGRRVGWIALGAAMVVLLAYLAFSRFPGALFPAAGHLTPALIGGIGVVVFLAAGALMLWSASSMGEGSSTPLHQQTTTSSPHTAATAQAAARPPEVEAAEAPVVAQRAPALDQPGRRQPASRQAQYLDASLSVARTLWTMPDLHTFVHGACETIADEFGFRQVMLYLMEAGGDWVSLQGASSVAGKTLALRGCRLPSGGIDGVGRVALSRAPLVMSIAERREQAPGPLAGLFTPVRTTGTPVRTTGTPVRTTGTPVHATKTLLLPLVSGERVVGILDIHGGAGANFVEDEVAALQKLADYLAVSLERVQRAEKNAAAHELGGQTYQTAIKLAVAQSERDVYEAMLHAAGAYRPTQILVVEAPRDQAHGAAAGALRVVASMQHGQMTHHTYDLIGAADAAFADAASADVASADVASTDVAQFVDVVILGLTLAHPLWVEDLSQLDPSLSPELRSALLDLAERWDMVRESQRAAADWSLNGRGELALSMPRALMFAPLRAGDGEAFGGLLVLYNGVHTFSNAERQVHQLFSDLGGAAVLQQRMYAEAQRSVERAAMLAAIRERLWQAEDADAVMQATVAELGRVLDVDVACTCSDTRNSVDDDRLSS